MLSYDDTSYINKYHVILNDRCHFDYLIERKE